VRSLFVIFAFALACGAPTDAPEPAEDPRPTGPPPVGDGPALQLLALEQAEGECHWRLHTVGGSATRLGRSPSCPEDVFWDPSGSAVYLLDGQLWRSRRGSEGEPVAVALPEIELGPMDGWESPWPSEEGALRIAAMLEAKVSEDGTTFTAAGLSATLGEEEWLPPWGLDGLVVVWEQGESGWTQLGVFPTRMQAGDTPGLSVAGDLLKRKNWPALAEMQTACGTGQDCQAPEGWNERLGSVVGAAPDDEVGFLPSGDGGWLFKVVYGDTPHAFPPVFWCADAECEQRTQLEDVAEGQLTVHPMPGHVLVATEYTGANPKVYTEGQAAPVMSVEAEASAWWQPEGS
jgi:hypothetical protein